MKVAVIGCGYVGLITGVCLAHKGHEVICVDKKRTVVAAINQGICPLYEKDLETYLSKVVGTKLKATLSLGDAMTKADVVIIAVGTPFDGSGIDLSAVKSAAQEVGRQLRGIDRYVTVIVKSTVVPGTTEDLIAPILEVESGKPQGENYGVCMSPEFLREGNAISDCMNPDRIIIGTANERSYQVVKNLYNDSEVFVMKTDPKTAEMIKYTSNALFATMISFSNEIANICARTPGLDVIDVMQGVHLDHRINPILEGKRANPGMLSYLLPSAGFGGSCFPKDLNAIIRYSEEHDVQARLLQQVVSTNKAQPLEVMRLLKCAYPRLGGRTVAILGLAFKPETDDLRESTALRIVEILLKHEVSVKVYDPIVKQLPGEKSGNLSHSSSWQGALKGADAVIIATPWAEFTAISQDDLQEYMKTPLIIDTRRILDRRKFDNVTYYGVGYCDDGVLR